MMAQEIQLEDRLTTGFSCNFQNADCILPLPAIVRKAFTQVSRLQPCLVSLSFRGDLCQESRCRHHELSHQFATIGCGILQLIWFGKKCTWLCFFPIECGGSSKSPDASHQSSPCGFQGLNSLSSSLSLHTACYRGAEAKLLNANINSIGVREREHKAKRTEKKMQLLIQLPVFFALKEKPRRFWMDSSIPPFLFWQTQLNPMPPS